MRGRCEIAIDAAGHELATSFATYPLLGNLQGVIKGDLQSIDGKDTRHIYYLRPFGNKAVPQWLANTAAAARDRDDIRVLLVVEHVGNALETSCANRGVGLLRLTDDNAFELVVDPDEFLPEAIEEALVSRIKDTRRRMERKLDLKKTTLEKDYGRVDELTSGMPSKTRDEYIDSVGRALTLWDEWSVGISQKLDEASTSVDASLVDEAEQMIEEDIEAG